jgi:uncharacterized damage-inducible protein DinB
MPPPQADEERYPIGPFELEGKVTEARRRQWIARLAAAPDLLLQAVRGLDEVRLETPYREGGWTVRQVVHHLPDSHLNAYVRYKLALTEDEPTIKPYDQARWADLADSRTTPVAASLALIAGLHERWVHLLRAMTPADFARRLRHPEFEAPQELDRLLALYAWHGDHHVAQILSLRRRRGWD